MHQNSIELMEYFRDVYLKGDETILDIGSRVHLKQITYKSILKGYKYAGMDIIQGQNVDLIGYDGLGSYDVVISGQTMEHVVKPWDWLKNLVQYFTKYICIIAPHTWREHRHPIDTYRYLPDGMRDLFDYAGIKEVEIIKKQFDTMGIGTK